MAEIECFTFGKNIGKSFEWVVKNDPKYTAQCMSGRNSTKDPEKIDCVKRFINYVRIGGRLDYVTSMSRVTRTPRHETAPMHIDDTSTLAGPSQPDLIVHQTKIDGTHKDDTSTLAGPSQPDLIVHQTKIDETCSQRSKSWYFKICVSEGKPGFCDDEEYESKHYASFKECFVGFIDFDPRTHWRHLRHVNYEQVIYDDGLTVHSHAAAHNEYIIFNVSDWESEVGLSETEVDEIINNLCKERCVEKRDQNDFSGGMLCTPAWDSDDDFDDG
jgi:hypothetical protein